MGRFVLDSRVPLGYIEALERFEAMEIRFMADECKTAMIRLVKAGGFMHSSTDVKEYASSLADSLITEEVME
jgi:hypothetical protein